MLLKLAHGSSAQTTMSITRLEAAKTIANLSITGICVLRIDLDY